VIVPASITSAIGKCIQVSGGVNRRWPHTRQLASCLSTAVLPSTEAPLAWQPGVRWPDSEDSAVDGAGGSAPGGWPSAPAGDRQVMGHRRSPCGCTPDNNRQSVPADAPVSTSRGISAPVSRQTLITAAVASVPSLRLKRPPPRPIPRSPLPPKPRGDPCTKKQ
jgi:hypothetical protein